MSVFPVLAPAERRGSRRRSVAARVLALTILSPALLLVGSTSADAAIVKSFTPVFSADTNGQIILRGNTNETCDTVYTPYNPNPPAPPAGSTACAEAQKGANGYNNQFVSKYNDVDSDATTFNSSSATIDVPAGSTVLYARLSWSGVPVGSTATNGAPEVAKENQVKLGVPGTNGYTTVTSATAVSVGDTTNGAYGASADVTNLVAAAGAGSYTVADIQAGLGNDRYAGWSMAIAYSNPDEPVRNLTIFDGWGTVRTNQTLDIPVSGFQTPPNGTVDSRVGVAAFEGDRGLTGDQLSLDGGNGFTKLINDANPENDFFNSSNSQNGAAVPGRNPGYDNLLGEDIDRFNATGLLKNNQTSATLRLSTTADVYYPQTVTFATELYAPKLSTTKTATDVNGGSLQPGDEVQYDIDVTNDGLDDAVKSQVTDAVPTNTTYVPGSLKIGGSAVTDAADADTGRFVTGSNQGTVQANLGSGANGTSGGTVPVGGTAKVSFRVKVNDDVYTDATITNTASASYQGAQTGIALSTSSNAASSTVTANRADLRVRTTADKPVVQRGDTAAYTLEVVNRGPNSAGGVQVANALPTGATVSSITTDKGTCSTANASCTLGTVPVGSTVTIHLVVNLPANAANPSSVTSTVSAKTIDPNAANDTSTASVGVNSPPTAPNTTATTTNGTATVDVLKNASDPDGDTLSVIKASVQPPAHGTVVVNNDGTLTYTADPGYKGSDTISYTISDGRGGTVTKTLSVTVPNAAPDAKDDDTTAAPTGGTPIDVLGNDTDPNNDPLTITSVSKPTGGTVTVAGDKKSVTFTPDAGFKGSTTFTYTISDGDGGSDTATVKVSVPNTAPVAADDDYDTPYATAKLLDVLADDRDDNGDPLSILAGSVTDPTSGGKTVGTAVIENGQIRFTPDNGFSGTATFSYTITDGNDGTSTATVTVRVGNATPVAGNGTATSDGTPTKVDVLANASDPNGDKLTVTGTSNPDHGSVALNADGTVTYTPAAGYKGADSFTYTVSDGNGGTATGTISVTVKNQPPTAVDVRRTAPSGTTITVPVLTGASDPNGDTLSLSDVSAPLHGTMSYDAAKGTITYTSEDGYEGSEVLTFTVSDGDGGTVQKTLTIRAVNVAPEASPDTTTVQAKKGGSVTLDVLTNDSDVNGDALTITGVTTPAGGTAVISPDKKQIVYTYADDYAGTDQFTYTVSDGRGGEDTALVTVTVSNTAPTAKDDDDTISRNATAIVDVLKNDTDANDDTLTLLGVDDPTDAQGGDAGTATVQDGVVVFTPTRGFTGTATMAYQVRDARGAVSTATLTVDVQDTAPDATHLDRTTAYDTTTTVDVVADGATDADGDELTLTAVGQPMSGGKVVGTVTVVDGKAVFDPDPGFSGPATFSYTVSDGLKTATSDVTVTVANGAPTITSGPTRGITATGTPAPITTFDPNGDTITVTVIKGSLPAGLTLNPDGTFTRTGPSKPGSYDVTVQACDDRTPQECVTQVLTITVDDTAPVAGDLDTSTPYDLTKTLDVLRAGDNPGGKAYDPDGDDLTITAVGEPTSGGKAVGTATIENGTIVFNPAAGFSGTATFTYTVSDGQKDATGTITVTVGNGAPTITSGPTRSLTATGTPDPITTSDPNGDTVTVALTKGPLPAGLTLNPDGTFTRTGPSKPGTYPITVQACDDRTPQECATQIVTITIEDTKPVAGDVVTTTPADQSKTVDVLRTGTNQGGVAYDADGDDLTITAVGQPMSGSKAAGTASVVDGKIVFVPAKGFQGVATFPYTVSDGTKSASGTITIGVDDAAPVAVEDIRTTPSGTKITIPVLRNDDDANGDPLRITKITAPVDSAGKVVGKATIVGDTISFVPPAGFRGPVTMTYTISDGAEESTATVTVNVANAAPRITGDTDQTVKPGSAPSPLTSTDPNVGDVTSVRVIDGKIPPGLTLNPDGTWSGTATTPGTYVSTVEVCDDQDPAACSTQKVTLRVGPAAATGGSGAPTSTTPAQPVSSGGLLPNTGSSALLPVAGLGGLLLLAVGAGLALRRRRREDGAEGLG